MSRKYYVVKVDGEIRFCFTADLLQASATIICEGKTTPFQTADARHDETEAARLLILWRQNQAMHSAECPVRPDEEWTVHMVDPFVYYIRLDQGDYLARSGWDWGRTTRERATRFKSRREAHRFARYVGDIAHVCREEAE